MVRNMSMFVDAFSQVSCLFFLQHCTEKHFHLKMKQAEVEYKFYSELSKNNYLSFLFKFEAVKWNLYIPDALPLGPL